MAISSPTINVGLSKFFTRLYPKLEKYGRLGALDFTDEVISVALAEDGVSFKFPVTSYYGNTAAGYCNGESVTWANAVGKLYRHGWKLNGIDLDTGADAARFAKRYAEVGASAIGIDVDEVVCGAFDSCPLDGTTEGAAATTAADYIALMANSASDAFSGSLVVTQERYADIITKFADANIVRKEDIVTALGVNALEVVPFERDDNVDMIWLPYGAFGIAAKKVAHAADYAEEDYITDEQTGLSVGVVVANDQNGNAKVFNVDGYLVAYVAPNAPTHGYKFGS